MDPHTESVAEAEAPAENETGTDQDGVSLDDVSDNPKADT